MAETRQTHETTDALEGVTLLAIPEEHIDQVRQYLASLQQEEADVAGYVQSGVPQTVRAGYAPKGTNCRGTQNVSGGDITCSDYIM